MAKLVKMHRKFIKLWSKYLSDPSMDTAIKLLYWANKLDWNFDFTPFRLALDRRFHEVPTAGAVLDVMRNELDAEGAPTERGFTGQEPQTLPTDCFKDGHHVDERGYCRKCGADLTHILSPDNNTSDTGR